MDTQRDLLIGGKLLVFLEFGSKALGEFVFALDFVVPVILPFNVERLAAVLLGHCMSRAK